MAQEDSEKQEQRPQQRQRHQQQQQRQQQQLHRAGSFLIEGSPLQSVYVPASRRSGTNTAATTRPPSRAAASDAGLHELDPPLRAEVVKDGIKRQKKKFAMLRGRIEHELERQSAMRPRLATSLALLSDWDGRDAVLALAQSVLLAVHHALSLPPPRRQNIPGYWTFRALSTLLVRSRAEAEGRAKEPVRRKAVSTHTLKQVYLSQELLASLRRCLLVGRWLSDLTVEASNRLSGGSGGGDGDTEEATTAQELVKADEQQGSPAPTRTGSFLLQPAVSLTDVARLAQHGLALEGILPLAGSGAASAAARRAKAAARQVAASASTGANDGQSGAAPSITPSSSTNSASSSVPLTLKRALLPFGEVRPALREGEDSVFAGSFSRRGMAEDELSPHLRQDDELDASVEELEEEIITTDDDEENAGGQLVLFPTSPQTSALLDVDSVDPADLSTPLPPIPHLRSRPASAFSLSLDTWLSIWETRLETILFIAGTCAELADVLAFFSGNSVAWRWFRRTYSSRLSPHLSNFVSPSSGSLISRRQRRGLERTTVYLSALCGVLNLILVRVKRNRAKRRRREVARRFRAVMDGMEWADAMQARAIASGMASSHLRHPFNGDDDGAKGAVKERRVETEGHDDDALEAQLAKLTPAQRAFLTYDGALETLTSHIRWLARERWAALAESAFMFYEIFRPGVDKEGWEAWTGILGGLVRVGRTFSERFSGRSV
ncbi:hypothetical protein V8E36_005471 [Tilletia maclaganii]